jgi:hypothetical protein
MSEVAHSTCVVCGKPIEVAESGLKNHKCDPPEPRDVSEVYYPPTIGTRLGQGFWMLNHESPHK